jgi:hypothetical protein
MRNWWVSRNVFCCSILLLDISIHLCAVHFKAWCNMKEEWWLATKNILEFIATISSKFQHNSPLITPRLQACLSTSMLSWNNPDTNGKVKAYDFGYLHLSKCQGIFARLFSYGCSMAFLMKLSKLSASSVLYCWDECLRCSEFGKRTNYVFLIFFNYEHRGLYLVCFWTPSSHYMSTKTHLLIQ